jgi:hypothetical protein
MRTAFSLTPSAAFWACRTFLRIELLAVPKRETERLHDMNSNSGAAEHICGIHPLVN